MLKVEKLSSTEPEKTLLLSFREMNTDSITDKSLSSTTVQYATQPKAPTDKKSKKKKNPSSSKPTSTYVRHSKQKKPVVGLSIVEEPVATVDITISLEASKSAEDVANQPSTASIEKEHETLVDESLKDLLAIHSSI
ncbi:hypothetical protein Tco_0162939 [Tanacetum coccineum]